MKERLLTLLLSLFCLTLTAEAQNKLGDTNGDGNVDAADIIEVMNFFMGRQSKDFKKDGADVNKDGDITIADVILIANNIISPPKEARHTLYIHLTDGTSKSVKLNTFPKVEMTADYMIIRSDGVEMRLSKAEVLKFTYN